MRGASTGNLGTVTLCRHPCLENLPTPSVGLREAPVGKKISGLKTTSARPPPPTKKKKCLFEKPCALRLIVLAAMTSSGTPARMHTSAAVVQLLVHGHTGTKTLRLSANTYCSLKVALLSDTQPDKCINLTDSPICPQPAQCGSNTC